MNWKKKRIKCPNCRRVEEYSFRRWDDVVICPCGKALSVRDFYEFICVDEPVFNGEI